MKKALIDYVQRSKNDERYTPKYAIEPLIKYLPKDITIWECTDYGKSQITQVLSEGGYKVISTHKNNFNKAQKTGKPIELCCAIGDEEIDGKPYSEIVEIARQYIKDKGGFEKFAEWGLY